ncbi:MAG: hypothetical protein IKU37_04640 [Candidatus Gastranaerophilales bacterium]|nr:hypothetical protein [Candidatus Gastranaerophilales bacterium]
MNISSISNFSYKALNFKGNNVSNPIDETNKSEQNNAPEIKLPEEIFYGAQMNLALKAAGQVWHTPEEPEEYPELDSSGDNFNQVQMAVDSTIANFKTIANMTRSMFPVQGVIPTLVKFDVESYLAYLKTTIAEIEAQIQDMDLPDIEDFNLFGGSCEIDEDFEGMEEPDDDISGFFDPEYIAQMSVAMLPVMLETQKKVYDIFSTSKKDELAQALQEFSTATNQKLYGIIQNGFIGNARGVVSNLTSGDEVYIEPEIIDNGNGTSTYRYTDILLNTTEVIKNNSNGDYISAKKQNVGGEKSFEVKFNKDGSISRLDYVNSFDKSMVSISQKGKMVNIKQYFENFVTDRSFIQQEDGSLKLTSARMSLNNPV